MKRDYLALAFAMLFPGLMAWLYFVALARQGETREPAVMVAFGAGKVIQLAFPLAYVWWSARARRLHSTPPISPTFPAQAWPGRSLVLGGLFGLATAAAILIAYFAWLKPALLGTSAPHAIREKLQQFGLASPAGFLLVAVFFTVFHSLLEEYYWRWFVFGVLRKHVALPAALVLSSLAFMAHHVIVLCVYFPDQIWTMALPFSLGVAVGGGVWAWVYQRTGSLLGAWLSHLLTDAAIMMVGYDMLFA